MNKEYSNDDKNSLEERINDFMKKDSLYQEPNAPKTNELSQQNTVYWEQQMENIPIPIEKVVHKDVKDTWKFAKIISIWVGMFIAVAWVVFLTWGTLAYFSEPKATAHESIQSKELVYQIMQIDEKELHLIQFEIKNDSDQTLKTDLRSFKAYDQNKQMHLTILRDQTDVVILPRETQSIELAFEVDPNTELKQVEYPVIVNQKAYQNELPITLSPNVLESENP